MTRSMTGYGRGAAEDDRLRVTVELRSVNHRFCDVNVKLPRVWMALEQPLAAAVRERLERGRVEVFARRELLGEAAVVVSVDRALAAAIVEQARALDEDLGVGGVPGAGQLLAMPGVLSTREAEVDAAAERPLVDAALAAALDGLVAMREAEGARMRADVAGYVDRVEEITDRAAAAAAEVPAAAKARLEARLAELLDGAAPLDPVRLAQEVAVVADKAAVDEEIARLRSHVAAARELLDADGAVGRRLEFLVQEMGRESNTIGSKAGDTVVAGCAVALKSVLEKIREQAANIE